ncbi:cyclase [Phenylobacterium sp. Root77]|nr:cyclase [Phenylobacterium sp. Root1277]KQW89787.1 cyclase [Phenylobacterium sp. Root1290]KRC43599.1 cyclase [Phenylobacterium sp. Root77]
MTAQVDQHDLAKETADILGWDDAAVFGRSVTVNKPRHEVYAFWRDFQNFPSFMENVRSVTIADSGLSHWIVEAPGGQTVEWDSVLTEDAPGDLIAWSSVEGADIKNVGRIEFKDAAPGRGTVVTATIAYDPPGGRLGILLAKLFQNEPKLQARRDLRRFKQFMETGEVATARTHLDNGERGQ